MPPPKDNYYDRYNYEGGNIEIYENAEFQLSEHYIQDSFTDKPIGIAHIKTLSLDDFIKESKFVELGSLHSTHILGFFLNSIAHFLIVVVTTFVVWRMVRLGLITTSLHSCFCTLGYLCFLAEGMMVIYSGNIWSHTFNVDTKQICHFILCFIGGILGLYGTFHKFFTKAKHFDTRHSRFGLVASLLLVLNIIIGSITKMSTALSLVDPRVYQIIHNALGFICFICAMVAIIYSSESGFFYREVGCITFFKISCVLILFLVLIGPFQNLIWKLYDTSIESDDHPDIIIVLDEDEQWVLPK